MNLLPNTKYKNNERTVSGNVPVENSDVLINVDTSLVPCTIYLKEIPKDYWSTLYILYIKDLTGNSATNNITIEAPIGYKINNQQSIILNVNSVCVTIKIASNTDYNTSYNTQTITGGHIIADEGTLLPQQPILNFVGDLVTASNGTGETVVTINNNLAVQNTVYVMKNGSDTTGLVERFDKPFLTITAAINAIRLAYPDANRNYLNRVKVIVEDGTYTETKISLYPYIDFDFGNSVIYSNISDYSISASYSANPNNDFTTKIFGNARIYRESSAVNVFYITNVNTRVLVQCDTVSSDRDDVITMQLGYAKFICNEIFNNNTSNPFPQFSHAIEMSQFGTPSSSNDICRLDIVNAIIYMKGNASATTIHFADITSGFIYNINQSLNLYNCTVINNLGSSTNNDTHSAIGVGITHPAQQGNVLNLYNTVIYSKYGKSIFVSNTNSTANLEVYYYNSNSANNAPFLAVTDATHTLTEYIGNFLIDSNVEPVIP